MKENKTAEEAIEEFQEAVYDLCAVIREEFSKPFLMILNFISKIFHFEEDKDDN